MVDRIDRTRDLAQRASDLTDNADVREQLHSIVQGLENMRDLIAEADEGTDPEQFGDRLQQIEAKLAGLTDKTDGDARERIEEARDQLDEFRQEYSRDW